MRVLVLILALLAAPVVAQQATNAPIGVVRVLDKTTGKITDLDLPVGHRQTIGLLTVDLIECRYPSGNPSGDAYAALVLRYDGVEAPLFQGWMIASSPALNPLDHPRYDVWVLRCKTS